MVEFEVREPDSSNSVFLSQDSFGYSGSLIDSFAYIEESLHPWDKPHLIMVYDPFNVLLDSVC